MNMWPDPHLKGKHFDSFKVKMFSLTISITHYKNIDYNMNVSLYTTCMVVSPIMINKCF